MKTFEFKGRKYGKGLMQSQLVGGPLKQIHSLGPARTLKPLPWRITPAYEKGFFAIGYLSRGKWKVFGWSRYPSIAAAMDAIARQERFKPSR